MGVELRLQLLQGSAAKFGIKQPGKVWGVATDMGMAEPGSVATVMGLSDGSASLYTTGSFGILGGEAHENVRAAAKQLCVVAERCLDQTAPVSQFPFPGPNRVRFYLLTPDGARSAEAEGNAIVSGAHPLSALFIASNDLLTELRKVAEAGDAD
jgi:hypothetical protein